MHVCVNGVRSNRAGVSTSVVCLSLIRSLHEVRARGAHAFITCTVWMMVFPWQRKMACALFDLQTSSVWSSSVSKVEESFDSVADQQVLGDCSCLVASICGALCTSSTLGTGVSKLREDCFGLTRQVWRRYRNTGVCWLPRWGVKKSIQHLSCESEWCKRHANTVPTWINIAEKCKRSTGGGLEQTPIVCFENCLHKSVLPPMFLTSYMIRSGYQHTHTHTQKKLGFKQILFQKFFTKV